MMRAMEIRRVGVDRGVDEVEETGLWRWLCGGNVGREEKSEEKYVTEWDDNSRQGFVVSFDPTIFYP
jgi:hypothetical protein